jgi:hypothetical protein
LPCWRKAWQPVLSAVEISHTSAVGNSIEKIFVIRVQEDVMSLMP